MMKTKGGTVWSVYLIKTAFDTLYCGSTTHVERRFSEHAKNGALCAKYLRGKQPLSLVWHYEVGEKQRALALEYQIKKLNKKNKIRLCTEKDYICHLLQKIIHKR